MTTFHASAPVRLDFAGGWTDVAPFSAEVGGTVVNAAIELRAHAEVMPGGNEYRLAAADLDETVHTRSLEHDGRLVLLKAALRRTRSGHCSLRTWSDVPPGSGLGSSGALGVALVAALDASHGTQRSPVGAAEEAWQVEAVDADLAGGRQDQYAAALGGFHRFTFRADAVTVAPIPVSAAIRERLASHFIVCYTGASRVSSTMIARVMNGWRSDDPTIDRALRGMADLADPMVEALLAGDLARIGMLLTRNWQFQMSLDPGMCTAEMARLESAVSAAGALGGKAAGAGAGGCMFFVCPDATRGAEAARAAGARLLPFAWADAGVCLS